jgi:hypothetical protein
MRARLAGAAHAILGANSSSVAAINRPTDMSTADKKSESETARLQVRIDELEAELNSTRIKEPRRHGETENLRKDNARPTPETAGCGHRSVGVT